MVEDNVAMNELHQLIDDFSGDLSSAVWKRISSRLNHLARRITKIRIEDEDE